MAKSTILLVEDEEIVALDLAGKLSTLGYEVIGRASRGEEAIELACLKRPQLILMDIRLKGAMDGIEAAERIRSQLDVPVIYLTAYSDAATLARAKLSEPFGYILKPFDERDLATTVEIALYKHQSERQLHEQRERLKESEERFRLAITATNDAIWDIDLATGSIHWNEMYASLYGRPPETGDSWQWWIDRIDPDDRERTVSSLRSAIDGSESMWTEEYRFRRDDGSWAYIYDRAHIARDESGKAWRIIGAMQDITERKRAEETLLRQAEELRIAREKAEYERSLLAAVMEALPTGVAITDSRGGNVKSNSAFERIWGEPRPNPQSVCDYGDYKAWWDDTGKAVEPEEWASALAAQKGEAVAGQIMRIQRFDGSHAFVSNSASPVRDDKGNIIGCAVAIQDITELKRGEEALRRAYTEMESQVAERTRELRKKDQMLITQSRQAAMGEMLGNIAHQWRQPLNSVALIMQSFTLMYDSGELNRENLMSMEAQVMELINHMSRTIDDFRNFFRPDKEKVEFHVLTAVENTVSLVEASFKNRYIVTEINVEDNPVIDGYRNEYSQALLNILHNARDALEAQKVSDPKVTVKVSTSNGRSVVSIADNAGGIPGNLIHKVFDPYFTTKGPDKGTGIGLFMSKAIIEKNMGGRLTVRNTADGAEFRVEV